MSHVAIVARVTVKEGKADEYVAAFVPLLEQAEKEPGTLLYAVHRSKDNPHVFWTTEIYAARCPASTTGVSRTLRTAAHDASHADALALVTTTGTFLGAEGTDVATAPAATLEWRPRQGVTGMTDDRPGWARRMSREREARNWSQAEAVRAMRAHSRDPLPEASSLLRQWKRWETGEHVPSDFYQPLIAVTFGTVTHAIFPVEGRRDANAELLTATGMDTLELVHRLQTSDADDSTIDSLRIVTDRMCSEYPYLPSDQLLVEGRNWLQRLTTFRGQRLTLAQHREILVLAGWLALLIGCVEYDTGRRHDAETTRRAALSLGAETDHAEISAWAHEMRAWMALTTGDYHGVIFSRAERPGRSAESRSRRSARSPGGKGLGPDG